MLCPRFNVFTAIFPELFSVLRWRSGLGRNHHNHVFGGDFQHFLHFLHRMVERVCLMFSESVAAATRKLPDEQTRQKKIMENSMRALVSSTPVRIWNNFHICGEEMKTARFVLETNQKYCNHTYFIISNILLF